MVRVRSPSSAAGEEYAEEAEEEEENEEEAEEGGPWLQDEEGYEEDEEEEEEAIPSIRNVTPPSRWPPPHANDGEERPWLLPPSRWWQQWNVSVAGPDHSRELDAANGGPRQAPGTPWYISSSPERAEQDGRYRSRSRRR